MSPNSNFLFGPRRNSNFFHDKGSPRQFEFSLRKFEKIRFKKSGKNLNSQKKIEKFDESLQKLKKSFDQFLLQTGIEPAPPARDTALSVQRLRWYRVRVARV